MNKDELKKMYEESLSYYIQQKKCAEKNYEISKTYLNGDFIYTHKIAVGLFQHIINFFNLQPGKTNSDISKILFLIAAFYQNIDMCEDAILNGYYTIAAGIVRQESEVLACINEIKNGKQTDGKVPHVNSGVIPEFGSAYGDLSALAHLSKIDEISSLFSDQKKRTDTNKPISLTPVFNENLCKQLFGLHIFFIEQIIEKLIELFNQMYDYKPSKDIEEIENFIIQKMFENGILIKK